MSLLFPIGLDPVFLRDDMVVVAGLKVAQVIAIGIAVTGVVWLLTLCRRGAPAVAALPGAA